MAAGRRARRAANPSDYAARGIALPSGRGTKRLSFAGPPTRSSRPGRDVTFGSSSPNRAKPRSSSGLGPRGRPIRDSGRRCGPHRRLANLVLRDSRPAAERGPEQVRMDSPAVVDKRVIEAALDVGEARRGGPAITGLAEDGQLVGDLIADQRHVRL